MTPEVLKVQNLHVDAVDRQGGWTPIVKNVSFNVVAGEVIALIGQSGAGKSTVSLACLGYAKPGCRISSGKVLLKGRSLLELSDAERRVVRGSDVAYIAQNAASSLNAAITIGRQVTEMPIIRKLMTREEAEELAVGLFRQLDLPNPERIGSYYPHQLSGGQLQRIMVAMAMMCDPTLLILDEPTTALDVTTQVEVLEAFRNVIREKKVAAIYVSHDLAVVAQMADEIMVLKDGEIVELNDTEALLTTPNEPYTRKLLAAIPVVPKSVTSRLEANGSSEPLLQVESVTAGYGAKNQTVVLHDVSLSVSRGETVGVIGESGSGKTTLGRVIAGLMSPISGRVMLDGDALPGLISQRTRDHAHRIQFVFQQADLALNPRHRVAKILGRPLALFQGLRSSEAQRRVAELLELVELPPSFANKFPHQLSGGQKQRINLARALAAETELIICDEITSSLDTLVAESIIQLLRSLRDRLGVAYVFISHDLSTIANFADHIAVMRHGKVVDFGVTEQVLSPPCHAYTELLLDSVPDLDRDWLDNVMAKRAASGD